MDHHGRCKDAMRVYLGCMRTHSEAHHLCKDESKNYLACRMERRVAAAVSLDKYLITAPTLSHAAGA